MLKETLAVFVGFLLWSVGCVAYNITLVKLALLPSDQTQPVHDVKGLLTLLLGSFILSVIAGLIAEVIAPASNLPVLVLGLLLLGVGIFFQTQYWHLMPPWYHFSFLGLLIPSCCLGAWLWKRLTG